MRRIYLFAIAFLWSLMIHAVTVEIDGIAYYINLENGEEGVIVGNNTQRQWAFVLNNKVQAKDVVIDSVPTIDYVSDTDNQSYLINGMTATKDHKGLVIIKSTDGKVRKGVR